MNKSLFIATILFLLLGNLLAQADNYKNFEWDVIIIGMARASAIDYKSRNGVSLNTEVRYNSNNQTSWGVMVGINIYSSSDLNSLLDSQYKFFLTRDQYFKATSPNRFFWGVATGLSGEAFALGPRFGLEFGHIRLMLHYDYSFNNRSPNTLGATIALTIWGGYNR